MLLDASASRWYMSAYGHLAFTDLPLLNSGTWIFVRSNTTRRGTILLASSTTDSALGRNEQALYRVYGSHEL